MTLKKRHYRCLLADPPWEHSGPGWLGGAEKEYPLMSVDEIAGLRISEYAANSAHLWLWGTEEAHRQNYTLEVARAWEFRPVAVWPWTKLTKNPLDARQIEQYEERGEEYVIWNGKPHGYVWPNGYYSRVVTEYLLLCVRGKNLTKAKERQRRRKIVAPWTGVHSEKPPQQYELIEAYSPPPRLEVFARKQRDGWDGIGNEVDGRLAQEVLL